MTARTTATATPTRTIMGRYWTVQAPAGRWGAGGVHLAREAGWTICGLPVRAAWAVVRDWPDCRTCGQREPRMDPRG